MQLDVKVIGLPALGQKQTVLKSRETGSTRKCKEIVGRGMVEMSAYCIVQEVLHQQRVCTSPVGLPSLNGELAKRAVATGCRAKPILAFSTMSCSLSKSMLTCSNILQLAVSFWNDDILKCANQADKHTFMVHVCICLQAIQVQQSRICRNSSSLACVKQMVAGRPISCLHTQAGHA